MSSNSNRKKTSKKKITPTILVAIIGLIGTIVAAIFSSPVLIALINKPLPTSTNTPPVVEILTTASPTENLLVTDAPSPNVFRVDFNNPDIPHVAPESISSKLINQSTNEASTLFEGALDSEIYLWATLPEGGISWLVNDENVKTPIVIGFDITSLVSGNEWIKLYNTFSLSISAEKVDEADNSITGVQLLREVGGPGNERGASNILLLSSEYNNFNENVLFPDSDFYTLQPGEFETFRIVAKCGSPGIYHIKITIPYTYKGKTVTATVNNMPKIVCPQSFTLWNWTLNYGFHPPEEYTWNDSEYIKASP